MAQVSNLEEKVRSLQFDKEQIPPKL
jgi:hypothetical protein